jgi:hypothetical protein
MPIFPSAILLALALYYAISACSGRVFNAFQRYGGWVYRSEQPELFRASILSHALAFATFLFLFWGHYLLPNVPYYMISLPTVVVLIIFELLLYKWARNYM